MRMLDFSMFEDHTYYYMIEINLSMTEKQKLESGYEKALDRREAKRIKSVLLEDEGQSTEMVTLAWRKHKTCIH